MRSASLPLAPSQPERESMSRVTRHFFRRSSIRSRSLRSVNAMMVEPMDSDAVLARASWRVAICLKPADDGSKEA